MLIYLPCIFKDMNTQTKKYTQKQKNQLHYEVITADFGDRENTDYYTGKVTKSREKYIQIINLFNGNIEEYKLTEKFNRVDYVNEDKNNYHYGKPTLEVMMDYVDNYTHGNGFRKANIIKDCIEANNEEIEKYIQREVEYRLKEELKKRGIEE